MSLTMAAPASSAARATSDFVVSTEIGVFVFARTSITGTTRSISSSIETGSPPGRVDSPPTSMISAPSAIICSARASALSRVRNCPPSLKLSGVTLRMPMMSVRSPMRITRSLMYQEVIHPQITHICVICGWLLGRRRIAARDRWQNRLERLRTWFFQLRPIFVVARIGNRRILLERQARDNPSNLNSIQRLTLQQALSQTNHRIAVLFDNGLRSFKLGRDDLLHLLIYSDGSVFREVAMLSNLASEEDLLFLFTEGERAHLRHAVLANHRACQLSRSLNIIRRSGGDTAEESVFRDASTH